jgi:nucleotide-binding universal stress UspA family protein
MTEQIPTGTPKKILLATDLSARCDRALDRAAALATAWQAELIGVHALEQDDYFRDDRLPSWRQSDPARIVEDQLRRDMLHAAPHVTAVAERAEPTELILRVAKARGCDLIVTGIARDETLGRFGLGATVDRLLRRSRVPLLIVKERVRAPYGNIIVATDFSECARGALQTAMAFFPDRKLGLFHAHDVPLVGLAGAPANGGNDYRDAVAVEAAAFLAAAGVAEEGRRRFGLLVERGSPAELIREYVRDRGVDLVVLGTHGRSALFDVFIGSTAKAILASLACDALVVREPRAAVEGEGR